MIDGITPKFVAEKEPSVVMKSKKLWENKNINEILKQFKSSAFLEEVVQAAKETKTDFMIAPYAANP